MFGLLRAIVSLVFLLVLGALALLFLPPLGDFSPRALSYSVGREANGDVTSSDFKPCRKEGRSVYRCEVSDGSGTATYRVRVDGDCWKARAPGSGNTGFPRRAHGCVRWRDQIRLLRRVF